MTQINKINNEKKEVTTESTEIEIHKRLLHVTGCQ